MDCAIQNTWKWQFFSFSPLFTLVFLYFFSTRKKAMHLFTQSTHSRHAIDIDNRLSVHGKKKKLNRCVFCIHSQQAWICLQDEVIVLSFYWTKRKTFHEPTQRLMEMKWNSFGFFFNWMKNDCISAGEHWFDYGCQLSARPILTSLNGLAHANIPMLFQ